MKYGGVLSLLFIFQIAFGSMETSHVYIPEATVDNLHKYGNEGFHVSVSIMVLLCLHN